jgi:flagellar biosynthesis protein FlhG
VEATFRFTRALFQRRIRRTLLKDRFKIRLIERAQADLPPLPAPQELVRALARFDVKVAELAAAELSSIRPRLVVNHARLRSDNDLGSAMCDMAQKYLGVYFDYVGYVEQDDSVWLSVVRRRPLLIDSPTCKSARNIERIARRVLSLAHAREVDRIEPIPLVSPEPTLYDVLFTHRGATDEELRRAYRRQREIYQADSLPLTSLLSPEELIREQARIDEAHDTLLDPLKRKAYDKSTFPAEEAAPPRSQRVDAAVLAEREMLREELVRELSPETEFSGAMLRKVREAQGIEISDISAHTKISAAYLANIENEDFEALPATVYVRGFVQQLARYLKLDPTQVSRTYLRRLRAWRQTHETAP